MVEDIRYSVLHRLGKQAIEVPFVLIGHRSALMLIKHHFYFVLII